MCDQYFVLSELTAMKSAFHRTVLVTVTTLQLTNRVAFLELPGQL